MFCTNCGHEVGNAKFCPACGEPVESEQQESENAAAPVEGTMILNRNEQPQNAGQSVPEPSVMPAPAALKKKKKKNKAVPVIVCLCLLLALGGGGYLAYKYYTSPMKQFALQLEQGNIDNAIMYLDQIDSNTKQQQAVQGLINNAQEIYTNFQAEAVEYSEASRSIDKIAKALEDNADIVDIREKLEALNVSRIAYGTAVKLQDSARYADAIEEYEKVISDDTYYDSAQQAISDCINLCRDDALSQAAVYEENGMYQEAIAAINIALAILPNDTKLISEKKLCESMLSEQQGNAALQKAAALLTSDGKYTEYKAARDVLKAYLDQNPSDAIAAQKLQEYDTSYYNGGVEAAAELAAEGDYDGAVQLLNDMAKDYEGNTELEELITKYENSKPVDLQSMEIFESEHGNYFSDHQSANDTWGNTWGNCTTIHCYYDYTASRTYLILSKYNHFHCTLAYEYTSNTKGAGYLVLLVDDTEIYRSETIDSKSKPVDIDVDVPEGQRLTLKFVPTTRSSTDVIIADAGLSVQAN